MLSARRTGAGARPGASTAAGRHRRSCSRRQRSVARRGRAGARSRAGRGGAGSGQALQRPPSTTHRSRRRRRSGTNRSLRPSTRPEPAKVEATRPTGRRDHRDRTARRRPAPRRAATRRAARLVRTTATFGTAGRMLTAYDFSACVAMICTTGRGRVGSAGLAIDLWYELECHPLDEAGKRKREPRRADDRDRQRNGDEEKADETPLHRPARVAPSQAFGRQSTCSRLHRRDSNCTCVP